MTKLTHMHKYQKKTLGESYKVFKCTVPGCTHYVNLDIALGRICLCNRCDKPMVLDKRSMKLAKPHCEDCIERQDNAKKIEERLKNLGL